MIIRMRGKISGDSDVVHYYPKPKKEEEDEGFIKEKEMKLK